MSLFAFLPKQMSPSTKLQQFSTRSSDWNPRGAFQQGILLTDSPVVGGNTKLPGGILHLALSPRALTLQKPGT